MKPNKSLEYTPPQPIKIKELNNQDIVEARETFKWIRYPENKPKHFCCCLVTNFKGIWLRGEKAVYYPEYDLFIQDIPERNKPMPLAISHYCILPILPENFKFES